jgi:hypothetical protein
MVAPDAGGSMQSVKPLLLVLLTYSLLSCATAKPATTIIGAEKTSKCGELPAGVTIDKREFRLAGAKLGEFSLGETGINSTPEFTQILSEASKNKVVQSVLTCNAIELAGVAHDAEMVAYFIEMQNFLSTNPSVDDRIKWKQAYPFPIKKSKLEFSEQEARKPKVELTFNGLSQKDLQGQFPLPLILEPSLTATLDFVVTNVGNGSVLNPLISVFVDPQTVRVDRRGGVYETKPNHHRYQVNGRTLLPKEMSAASYEFTVEVLVPAEIDAFTLLFRIVGDNLPHEDLVMKFQAIHYKRPEGS